MLDPACWPGIATAACSPSCSPRLTPTLAARLGATHIVVEGSGHAVPLHRSAVVAEAILDLAQ